MASQAAFSQRLATFKERFQNLVTRKHAGYDELGTLDRPLMSDDSYTDDAYANRHGVSAPGQYQGPVPGYEGGRPAAGRTQPPSSAAGGFAVSGGAVPSQAEEIRLLATLSKDAAELLWEMVAMGDQGESYAEMLSKTKLLQAQLRGMIGDYNDSDEAALASALEAFDILNRVLEENEEVHSPRATTASAATTAPPVALAPPPGGSAAPAPAATSTPAVDERPLIEF